MTPKERYFRKVFAAAPWIKCACGCGDRLKAKDEYARDRKYVSGHNNRKYEDPRQHKREWNHRNRPARRKYKAAWLHKVKGDLIKQLGGKCNGPNCVITYDGTNASLFDFHHLRDKKFMLAQGELNKRSLADIKEEAAKCQLLCSNCHRLHHSGSY